MFEPNFVVKYLGGIPEIDKMADSYNIKIFNDHIQLWRVFSPTIEISFNKISSIESQTTGGLQSKLSAGKALIGGILLGPLGLLLGGMMGKKVDNRIMYFTINYLNEIKENSIAVFESKDAHNISNKISSIRYKYLKENKE